MVAAILIQLERHSRYPEVKKGLLSYAGPVRGATGGSMHHAAPCRTLVHGQGELLCLVGHAVNRRMAVSSAVKDGGMENEAETGVLSIEA
jgi:hypothetical protein